jgi:hypothetical protein
MSDADQVGIDYAFQARYASNPTGQNNFIMYISSNTPYRAHTVWNTAYEAYYVETGDPRTAWESNAAIPNTEVGQLPWYKQRKYPSLDSPINLMSGREMVLIKAEIALRAGDWQNAITLINGLRQGLVSDHDGSPIPLATATSLTEAWTALKRERAVELWLESRRLGDLWRWVEAGTPGEMEDVSDRIRLCFPVATSELQTNPNIPLDYESPRNPLFGG